MGIVDIDDYRNKTISWKQHRDSKRYWLASIDDETVFLRMNNFPDEPLYSLITKSSIRDFEDLPECWILDP